MARATPHPGAAHPRSPGAAWVDRYLVPQLAHLMPTRSLAGLRILQLDPDDAAEATRCQELGAAVTLGVTGRPAFPTGTPTVITLTPDCQIDAPDDAFDVILTGHLERLASRWATPQDLVRQCARVCAPGGGLLAPLSTRCPVNLTGDAPALALARPLPVVGVRDLEAAFGAASYLPIKGHFGWSSGGPARRAIGAALDVWWRWCATPRHPRIYTSAANPIMLVWALKPATR